MALLVLAGTSEQLAAWMNPTTSSPASATMKPSFGWDWVLT
jgi:hypothetical protein